MVYGLPFVLTLHPANLRDGPERSRSFPEACGAARMLWNPVSIRVRGSVLPPPMCITQSHICVSFSLMAADP